MMNTVKLPVIFVTIFVLTSCGTPTKNTEIQPISNYVTIIFRDAPPQSSTRRFYGSFSIMPEGTLVYVDSTDLRVFYTPRSMGYDTITIPATSGYAEIEHRNQAIESIYYLLKAGDTVLFTYGDNMRPQISSLTSDDNTRLYNLLWDDPRSVQPIGYSTYTIINNRIYKMADEVLNRPKKSYPKEIIEKSRLYYLNIDSLRPVYDTYLHDITLRIDSLETSGSIGKIYADYYRKQLSGEDSLAADSPLSDSLMRYISYYNKAMDYQYKVCHKETKSPVRFDIIAADTSLTETVKKAILHNILSSIESGDYWRSYPPEIVQKYRTLYQDITGDTTFRINTVSKENLVLNGYSTDLVLEGLDGKPYDYKDILAKNRGKVIYIDLWASWCGPCRATMPGAKKLREEYKGQNVEFIYLAINDSKEAWQGAVRSCETDYLGDNYRVLNAGESQLLKEIKNHHIPHTLLYDRDGKLVNTNAPHPNDEDIRTELNKLLK